MLTSKSYWRDRTFPLFATDGAGGGAGGGDKSESKPDTDDSKDDLDAIEGLGDKGKDAIRREREARAVAVDEAKKAKKERDALLKEKQERESAEQDAKDDDAAKRGEFEDLAKKRERERDTARTEAASLKADNDQLREAINSVLEAEWKALPPEVTDAFLGDDDDALGKLLFLPKGKALAIKLAEKADPARGNGQDPRSRGASTGNKATEDEARRANASRYAN